MVSNNVSGSDFIGISQQIGVPLQKENFGTNLVCGIELGLFVCNLLQEF